MGSRPFFLKKYVGYVHNDQKMSGQKTVKSGIAMVQISGRALRSLREKQGVTQLYLATAVGVTTETISRWERQDSPTLKEENAVKLADVLSVPLGDMLVLEGQPMEDDKAVSGRFSTKKRAIAAGLVILLAGVLANVSIFFNKEPVVHFTAKRIAPSHTAPGQMFPVLLKIAFDAEENSSLLLKEQLPQGCSVIRTIPEATATGENFLKWVARDGSRVRLFAYLAKCTSGTQNKAELLFRGSLLVRRSHKQEIPVGGSNQLQLSNFHWADSNQDSVIDDEELLAVYDEFDLVKGLNINVEEIESIWMGSGYRWKSKQSLFEILP